MAIWFTADTEFFHRAIIGYCGRPFRTVEDMNAVLVERWNARVCDGDTVYVLGDFAYGPFVLARAICEALRGQKILVQGNHDGSESRMRRMGFAAFYKGAISCALPGLGTAVRLTHQPIFDALPTLCGHVHEKWKRQANCLNVGVDQWGFAPVSVNEASIALGEDADVAM